MIEESKVIDEKDYFEVRYTVSEDIAIPETKPTIYEYRHIKIRETIIVTYLVDMDRINEHSIDLSTPLSNFMNSDIIVLILYVTKDTIQYMESFECLTSESLEVAISFCYYYVMIDIPLQSVTSIVNHSNNTNKKVVLWIEYVEPDLEKIFSGVIGVTINQMIILSQPIKIYQTMTDFLETWTRSLYNIQCPYLTNDPKYFKFQNAIEEKELQIKMEYERIRDLQEQQLGSISPDHPFMINMTTRGKSLNEHSVFDFIKQPVTQSWIIIESLQKAT